MTKLKLTLIFATVAISAAIALFIHQNAKVKMRENQAALRQQESQLNQLLAEQQRLSNQVAEAKNSTNSQLSELTNLRNKAQALQEQTNKLGIQVKSNRQLRASQRVASARILQGASPCGGGQAHRRQKSQHRIHHVCVGSPGPFPFKPGSDGQSSGVSAEWHKQV